MLHSAEIRTIETSGSLRKDGISVNGQRIADLPEAERDELIVSVLHYLAGFTFYPRSVFEALCKLTPTVFCEVVTFAKGPQGALHILLTKRPADDPYWSGQWHSPGKFLRTNWSFDNVVKALEHCDEIGLTFSEQPGFAGVINYPFHQRCHGVVIVFVRMLEGKPIRSPKGVRFFPVSRLDQVNMIAAQRMHLVPKALSALDGKPPSFSEDHKITF